MIFFDMLWLYWWVDFLGRPEVGPGVEGGTSSRHGCGCTWLGLYLVGVVLGLHPLGCSCTWLEFYLVIVVVDFTWL